jgi:hypothetical protein
MYLLEGWPIEDYLEKLRSEKKEKFAWQVISDFFEFFDQEGPKEILRDMLTISLISDREDITGKLRSDMIFFYTYSKALYEALYFLYEQRENRKRGK